MSHDLQQIIHAFLILQVYSIVETPNIYKVKYSSSVNSSSLVGLGGARGRAVNLGLRFESHCQLTFHLLLLHFDPNKTLIILEKRDSLLEKANQSELNLIKF